MADPVTPTVEIELSSKPRRKRVAVQLNNPDNPAEEKKIWINTEHISYITYIDLDNDDDAGNFDIHMCWGETLNVKRNGKFNSSPTQEYTVDSYKELFDTWCAGAV